MEQLCTECGRSFVSTTPAVLCPRCEQRVHGREPATVDPREIHGTLSYRRQLWKEKYDE